jgi:hypothetical protein
MIVEIMKSRLFVKFLLLLIATSLSVVILMVVTMQFFVYRNFSDYVMQQELDSLDGLAQAVYGFTEVSGIAEQGAVHEPSLGVAGFFSARPRNHFSGLVKPT